MGIYGWTFGIMGIYGKLYGDMNPHKSQHGFIKKINTVDSNPHKST